MHVYPVARTQQCSAEDPRKMEDPKDMEDRKMMWRKTRFRSLEHYEKGGVEVINDDPRNYAFSNIFEVASKSEPYEKVAVAKNLKYVLETIRAEGTSPWYTAAHDESAIIMDGEVEIRLIKVETPAAAEEHEGTTMLEGTPRASGWATSWHGAAIWRCCPKAPRTSSTRPSRA